MDVEPSPERLPQAGLKPGRRDSARVVGGLPSLINAMATGGGGIFMATGSLLAMIIVCAGAVAVVLGYCAFFFWTAR
jgi:hypothetical protein